MVTASQAFELYKQPEIYQKTTFDIIRRNCDQNIRAIAPYINYLVYRIPRIVPGRCAYNIKKAAFVLKKDLEDSGFRVHFLKVDCLLIRWFANSFPKKEKTKSSKPLKKKGNVLKL
jgi:hypothetical protein